MENYFENKVTFNGISFCLSNTPDIKEREIHSYHEILLFIRGDVQLLTKGGHQVLKKRSVIVIPRDTYHFFRLNGFESFERLKISFTDYLPESPLFYIMQKMKIFERLTDNTSHAFDRLCEILGTNTEKTGFYAYSAFLMLLCELDISDKEYTGGYSETSPVMTNLIDYISENLSGDLSVSSLSRIFLTSTSSISHMFKKEFGISVHKYITLKRLMMAKKLVDKGCQVSKIYREVGFKDYSSFYKAYVKMFSHSPSKDK